MMNHGGTEDIEMEGGKGEDMETTEARRTQGWKVVI